MIIFAILKTFRRVVIGKVMKSVIKIKNYVWGPIAICLVVAGPVYGSELEKVMLGRVTDPELLRDFMRFESEIENPQSLDLSRTEPYDRVLKSYPGQNLSQLWMELCAVQSRRVRENKDCNIQDESRYMVLALIRAIQMGRSAPEFQGRRDWGLHFLMGVYFGAGRDQTRYGEDIGKWKEEWDARTAGNTYDAGDLAATWLGVRWVEGLTSKRVETYANGEKRLDDFQPIPFGRLPPQILADDVLLHEIKRYTMAQIKGEIYHASVGITESPIMTTLVKTSVKSVGIRPSKSRLPSVSSGKVRGKSASKAHAKLNPYHYHSTK